MTFSIEGDGSRGINGKLEISDRNMAITLIDGLIEQFNIKRDELDL
jgi:hypothetical protein